MCATPADSTTTPMLVETVRVTAVEQVGPMIDARVPFAAERSALLELLTILPIEAWTAPTICPGWSVHDIVVHLLHDDLRRLARTRDHYFGGPLPKPGQTLPEYLNAANQRFVTESGFLSPRLLVELLASSSALIQAMWTEADRARLDEGVWWAGVESAPRWLDLARDYSEDWTHHQQSREAVGADGLNEPRFLDPALDTFRRALPHTYRHIESQSGLSISVVLNAHGRELNCYLDGDAKGWIFRHGHPASATATVTMPADVLWRLATGGVDPDTAALSATMTGDQRLTSPILNIVAVVR
jgi:uncharacterized protein (TIGR03083 family)